jgi:hypothetical protein
MRSFKVALSFLLYIASCLGLLISPMYISMALAAYSADFVASHGPRVPAFSASALSLMRHAGPICFSVLVVSLLLAVMAVRRSEDRQAKLYWLGILANINFYTVVFLFGSVLIGFFLLPKVANGV